MSNILHSLSNEPNTGCMTSKHHESYREQTAPTDLYIMTAPRAFESLSRYFDVVR